MNLLRPSRPSRTLVVALPFIAGLLLACTSGTVSQSNAPSTDWSQAKVETVRIGNKTCEIAVIWMEHHQNSNSATGGPAVLNLGCEVSR